MRVWRQKFIAIFLTIIKIVCIDFALLGALPVLKIHVKDHLEHYTEHFRESSDSEKMKPNQFSSFTSAPHFNPVSTIHRL